MAPDPAQRWPSAADLATAAATASAILRAAPVPDAGRVPRIPPSHNMNPPSHAVYAPAATPTMPVPAKRRRRWDLIAVVVTVLVLTIGTIAVLSQRRELPPLRTGATTQPAGSAQPTGSAQPIGSTSLPAGFVACGRLICPTTPQCWAGLTQIGDVAEPPRSVACTEPHYWETFAVVPLPADARTDHDLSHLMDRSDIAAECSDAAMAALSADATHTLGWRRDAWPVAANAYTTFVHCLGGSPQGESVGSVFTH
jgi:serine/threonine-protein kinase